MDRPSQKRVLSSGAQPPSGRGKGEKGQPFVPLGKTLRGTAKEAAALETAPAAGGNVMKRPLPKRMLRPETEPPAVKEELFDLDPTPRPGETEREAKRRVLAERIRAEARQARQGSVAADPAPAPAPASAQPASAPSRATGAKGANAAKGRGRGPGAAPSGPSAAPATASTISERKRQAPASKAQVEEDTKKLEAILPGLEEKVVAVEDEAEKVSIVAAPLEMEHTPELKDLQEGALRDTERAVKVALGSVMTCRREMDRKRKEIQDMAPVVQRRAEDDLAQIISRLDAAEAKINEHKSARADFQASNKAEKFFGELATRMVSIEMDCEKAAVMSDPLQKALDAESNDISSTEVREAKEAARIAQATLAPTMRLIAGTIEGVKGSIRKRFLDLQSRAEASQVLLDRTQKTVDEAQSRLAVAPVLKQVAERLNQIEEVLEKMRETESPFLMGIETVPAEEGADILQRMDKAAALAHSACVDATKYVGLKLIEVGRMADGTAEGARKELEKAKAQIDGGLERVKTFQAEAATRRRVNLVAMVKQRVEDAEAIVVRMKEAGAALQEVDPEDLQEALDKAQAAGLEAQNAITAARREVQERQQEARQTEGGQGSEGLKSTSELLKTNVRVKYMEAELSKFKKSVKDFDEKIKVGKSLTDISSSLAEAETEVDRISTAAQDWPKDERAPEEDEKAINVLQESLSALTGQVEQKLQGAQGLELKELRGIFQRLQQTQWKLDKVKEAAKTRLRALTQQIIKVAAAALNNAESKISTVSASAKGNLSAARLDSLQPQASAMLELVEEARQAVAKGQASQLLPEAKVEIAKLQLRCKALERKGKVTADTIKERLYAASAGAMQEALQVLRAAAPPRENGGFDADSLFRTLSNGMMEITEAQFCDFFTRSGADLSAERAQLAFRRMAPHGLFRRTFGAHMADFRKVVRDITVTDGFNIQTAKKVRKLEAEELIEVLSADTEDSNLGLVRAKCRAIRDDAVGWVTVRSTGGTTYLGAGQMPFVWCAEKLVVREAPGDEAKEVRELLPGEVLEMVAGPREERMGSDFRVRGAACSSSSNQGAATGWLQVRDKAGTEMARLSASVYKCVEAIAMTDLADFDTCTMVRRIEAGEALELLPEDEAQPGEGGTRRKFRACRDGKEGWVTTQGSQGTVYVKGAAKHYICTQAAPVHIGLSPESDVMRVLMPGEAFAAYDQPKEVGCGEKLISYKVRVGSTEGWVSCLAGTEVAVNVWHPRYEVLGSVPLTSAHAASEAAEVIEVLRILEAGELVDVVELPSEDVTTGQLRCRLVAVRDKAVGWATVRMGTGASSVLLRPTSEPVGPGEAARAAKEEDLGAMAPSTPPRMPAAPSTPPLAKGKGKRPKGKGKGKFK